MHSARLNNAIKKFVVQTVSVFVKKVGFRVPDGNLYQEFLLQA
jgi:hypothetical protein